MTKRVLVVEDETSVSSLLVDVIETLNCEARVLNDGEKVLETALSWKPDLITLDLMLPKHNGADCLSELKQHPDTRKIPVIVISVVAQNSEFAGQILAAEKVFEKPLQLSELLRCIKLLTQL